MLINNKQSYQYPYTQIILRFKWPMIVFLLYFIIENIYYHKLKKTLTFNNECLRFIVEINGDIFVIIQSLLFLSYFLSRLFSNHLSND